MKIILVGFGSFGRSWYEYIQNSHPNFQVAVVDTDPTRVRQDSALNDRFYTSLVDAIENEQPDFLLNATPPQAHTAINHLAFDYRLPVLCEKPIAADYQEAVQVVRRAIQENVPFMIAENYRRLAVMRQAKQLITKGTIGTLRSLHGDVYRTYHTDKPYFLQMEHPFLVDVAIHHLDLIRYLSSSEGHRILAHSFHPAGSWHPGKLALVLFIEMRNGVIATLDGSLTTQGPQTDWLGSWRLEGSEGSITVVGDHITITREGQTSYLQDFNDASKAVILEDFLMLLQGKQQSDTDGRDYLNTQALVHFALQSIGLRQVVDIDLPSS